MINKGQNKETYANIQIRRQKTNKCHEGTKRRRSTKKHGKGRKNEETQKHKEAQKQLRAILRLRPTGEENRQTKETRDKTRKRKGRRSNLRYTAHSQRLYSLIRVQRLRQVRGYFELGRRPRGHSADSAISCDKPLPSAAPGPTSESTAAGSSRQGSSLSV